MYTCVLHMCIMDAKKEPERLFTLIYDKNLILHEKSLKYLTNIYLIISDENYVRVQINQLVFSPL